MTISIFELSDNNSWWVNRDSVNNDFHLKTFDESLVKWEPGLKRYIPLDVSDYVLYTIRGPRQVGKTTLVKLLMRELLHSEIDPLQVFFWPCDAVPNPTKLEEIISSYIGYAQENFEGRLYIFLDEVTSIRDWQLAIKILYDKGFLKNTTIVACGSHAMDVKAGAEKLPGRTGVGDIVKHKRLVPMKFAEFIKCYNPEFSEEFGKKDIHKGKNRRKILIDLISGKDNDLFSWLLMQKKDLDTLLETYMLTGGIACAINEYKKNGAIRDGVYSDYIRAFQSDLAHWRRDTNTAKHIVSGVIKATSSVATWHGLKGDMATHPTIKSYVETMCDCFVMIYFDRLRIPGRASRATEKGKKIYIPDPFLFHSLRYWTSPVGEHSAWQMSMDYLEDGMNRGKFVEAMVGDHLIRFAFNLNPSDNFDARNEIFYWKKKKEEIDFIVNFKNGLLPVEAKYRTSIPNSSLKFVNQFAKDQKNIKGIIVSKDDFGKNDNFVIIPASIFLVLI
jgi:hypothetical protein